MARAPAIAETEELPEADRLEDFPHPRNTRAVFGHAAAEETLAGSLAADRVHHAWLLAGPKGIGKATLAYRFARAALAAPEERDMLGASLAVPDEAIAARQVRSLSHPGLMVIRRPFDLKAKRFASTIPVDEIRRLRSFLAHRAVDDGWRIIIVDEANELNVSAANALLKSLEEPPARLVFLLITSAPGALLPTIRSRCRVLEMGALSPEDLRRAAEQALAVSASAAPTEADWEPLNQLAEGSVGRLLSLHSAGGIELQRRIDTLVGLLPRVDWRAVHTLADELQPAAASGRFELFYELLLNSLGRLVRAAATGEGTPADQRLAARLIGEGQLASFAALWERVGREKADAVALNLDRKGLVLDTVSALAAVAAENRKPA